MRVSRKLPTAMRSLKRGKRGILGSMMLVSLILIMISLLSLGVDYSHLVAVRAQLRNAADAAALSGAMQLWKDPNTCAQYAYTVCEQNLADGITLDKDNHHVLTVTADTIPPSGSNLGTVTVTIDMLLKDLVSPIFGRFTDHVKVVAVAGGAGDIVRTNENVLFPIAVSKDRTPGEKSNGNANGKGKGNSTDPGDTASMKSLIDAINGDKTFTMYINSQKFKNAAFTSFTDKNTNHPWLDDAIAQCLGITGKGHSPVTIPSVQIGVDNIYLANGVMGEKTLAEDPYFSKLVEEGRNLVLPVIEGDPAYNQSRLCIGFVVVHVTAIHKTQGSGNVESIDCVIKDAAIPGVSGTLLSSGDPAWDTAYAKIKPHTVKLLQ